MGVLFIGLLEKVLTHLHVAVINMIAIMVCVGTFGLIGFAIAKNAISYHGGNRNG